MARGTWEHHDHRNPANIAISAGGGRTSSPLVMLLFVGLPCETSPFSFRFVEEWKGDNIRGRFRRIFSGRIDLK